MAFFIYTKIWKNSKGSTRVLQYSALNFSTLKGQKQPDQNHAVTKQQKQIGFCKYKQRIKARYREKVT